MNGVLDVAVHLAHIERVVTAYGMTAQHAESLSVVREGIKALSAQVEALKLARDQMESDLREIIGSCNVHFRAMCAAEERADRLQAELDGANALGIIRVKELQAELAAAINAARTHDGSVK